MPASRLRRLARRAAAPAAAAMLLTTTGAASADTVVPNNQIVQGYQCVGPLCANGEAMGSMYLWEKSSDTPGLRLLQTGSGGFTPQTWDVAGNEANFFIRDLTGGSRLPFRIRPGAPTSSIDIGATGEVSTAGVVQQMVNGITPAGTFDGDAALAALRTLTISDYAVGGATHAMPAGAAFRAAFGLGASDDRLAPQDVAAVALAAVKALDARVSAIALTPGPKGDTGAAGADGARGDTGAAGPKGDAGTTVAAPAAALAQANARIARLERSNAKLSKGLSALQRQVRALMKTKSTRKATKAGAHRTGDGR
jgi:hypothetical protein